jgi:type I restriction enzyme S subunit
MNVPQGYRMTEVGVIPEDWEVKAFADVVSLRKQRIDPCRNQSENYDFCIELENIESGSGQILGYSNLRDNASLKSVFYKDDVLFGKLRAYLRKYWLADREGLCSTEIWVFVSKTEQILPSYLFQTIQSKGFIDLAITAYGTHMPRSDWNVVKNYPLLTPPLPEQQAIARVLSDTDELINALDKLIAKKRDIKKAVMQELLTGKTRLPGFSGEWEVKKLGDIGSFRGGNSFPTIYQGNIEGCYPFFKVSDMNNNGNEVFMVSANNYISELTQKKLCITVFPKGSIVFAKVGAAIFLERKKILNQPSCIDNNMMAFILNTNLVDTRFIHTMLHLKRFGCYVSTTALPSLSGKQLSEITVVLPPISEQQAIAQVLSDMDREITALEQRRDKTKALKQGMMQALLTGRIRLH